MREKAAGTAPQSGHREERRGEVRAGDSGVEPRSPCLLCCILGCSPSGFLSLLPCGALDDINGFMRSFEDKINMYSSNLDTLSAITT